MSNPLTRKPEQSVIRLTQPAEQIVLTQAQYQASLSAVAQTTEHFRTEMHVECTNMLLKGVVQTNELRRHLEETGNSSPDIVAYLENSIRMRLECSQADLVLATQDMHTSTGRILAALRR